MRRLACFITIVSLYWTVRAAGQDGSAAPPPEAAPNAPSAEMPGPINLDEYEAVRQGNQLLRGGAPADALKLYQHAETLQPDAREIAFAEGLGHYQLGEYETAREAFQRAWLGEKDSLADDALYSEGAAYHAEALGAMSEPEVALDRIENAMQRYQSVLANRPDHDAARDANYKAGAAWRQIKQQMQEQQQQQDQNNDDQEENDENQDEQQQQQEQDQQNEDEQQQQNDPPPDSDQKQDQESENQKDNQSQQEQNPEESQPQESEPQPDDQQKQQQEVSREQAERKLREMMQAQRQRQKDRKKQRAIIRVPAAEKDW